MMQILLYRRRRGRSRDFGPVGRRRHPYQVGSLLKLPYFV